MNKDQRTSSVRSAFASMAGAYVSSAKPAVGTVIPAAATRTTVAPAPLRSAP